MGGEGLGVRGGDGHIVAAAPAPAHAQELSDKAILTLMEYAWALMPEQFTKPNGETIVIDKTKRAEVIIPLESRARLFAPAVCRPTPRPVRLARSRATITAR